METEGKPPCFCSRNLRVAISYRDRRKHQSARLFHRPRDPALARWLRCGRLTRHHRRRRRLPRSGAIRYRENTSIDYRDRSHRLRICWPRITGHGIPAYGFPATEWVLRTSRLRTGGYGPRTTGQRVLTTEPDNGSAGFMILPRAVEQPLGADEVRAGSGHLALPRPSQLKRVLCGQEEGGRV